jgi:hypothetical protein
MSHKQKEQTMDSKRMITVLTAVVLAGTLTQATDFNVSGVYNAMAQSQHDFTFTKNAYDHNYVVQMLRFKVQGAANDNLKFVTRFDIAQGWWGVDNALKSKLRTGTGGGSALFDFKDTNFLMHVDQAYVDFALPNRPLSVKVGRMWYGLGHKIILDNNYDGIQIGVGKRLTLGWAKVSEGGDNLADDFDAANQVDNRDADLYIGKYSGQFGNATFDAFGLYYRDQSIADGDAYIHDDLQFFKTRFSPQVTRLTAFGLSGIYKLGKLVIDGEFNYLIGKDEIDNDTHAGAKPDSYDLNDGNLKGFNLYTKLNYAQGDNLSFGAVVGIGSGDDDLTGGPGNVNKLRTSGFFYITEVWEDSIMPDEEGITPQGLGAPNIRGYRELENTTILQANATWKGLPNTSLFLSGSYLKATQPVSAWSADTTGAVTINNGVQATTLGTEVDFKLTHKVYPNLLLILRGGYFFPGDAAAYLINGNNDNLDPAYELKGMVVYKF